MATCAMAPLVLMGLLALSAPDAPHQTWTGEPVPELTNYESIPAFWHQDLASTSLQGYKKGEHLIISSLYTGTMGKDSVIRHMLEVKVSGWDKPFSTTLKNPAVQEKETFTVTLHEMPDPKTMRADFEHVVLKDDKMVLRFSGSNILARIN